MAAGGGSRSGSCSHPVTAARVGSRPPAADAAPAARPAVASATAQEPLDHAATAPGAPDVLLRQALAHPEQMGLEGQAVTLRQVLERNGGSQPRQRVVTAYWRLCQAVAAFQFASSDATQAANLPAPQARHQSHRLDAHRLHARRHDQIIDQPRGGRFGEGTASPPKTPCGSRRTSPGGRCPVQESTLGSATPLRSSPARRP